MVFQDIRKSVLKNKEIDFNQNTIKNFPFGKGAEVPDSAITNAKISDSAITNAKIADNAAIAWNKIAKTNSKLSDIEDVILLNLKIGQIPQWNGSTWINVDPPMPPLPATTWDPNATEALTNKTMDYTQNTFLNFPIPATVMPDRTITTVPKFGRFFGGSAQGDGLFGGLTIHGTLSSADYPEGMHTVFNTALVDAQLGGFSTTVAMTRRAYNPTFKISFRNVVTTERMFVGLVSQATQPVDTDDILNSLSGIGVSYSDVVNNFTGLWNGGASTNQKITSSIPKDSNNHVIIITLDDTLGKATLNFDGTDLISSTTNIPASTTALWLHCNLESIGTSGGTFAVAYAYVTQDK
jgi:hypothetical protein